MNRILIFGATSAIAQAAARQWVAQGAAVFLVGRNPAKLQALVDDLRVRAGPAAARVASAQADLDDVAGHPALLAQALQHLGGLDVVLMAQGSLPDQRACEASVDLTLAELHTNGNAVVALCTRVATTLAAQRSGCLAVISSVAGDRGRQSNYVYGAAKGLLSLYLQGLRNRLHASGVQVLTIKPGFVDTPMTAAIEKKGLLWAQPEAVAAGILRAINQRRDVVYLPGFWRGIMAIIRAVPERVFKRLSL